MQIGSGADTSLHRKFKCKYNCEWVKSEEIWYSVLSEEIQNII